LKDPAGNQLYAVTSGDFVNLATTCTVGYSASASAPCVGTSINKAINDQKQPFLERFLGDSAKPRISVGFGVNWNSPFGPLRIDVAKTLVTVDGDDSKLVTFNVGTQF
jgi:outer membrane protein insertion porin family